MFIFYQWLCCFLLGFSSVEPLNVEPAGIRMLDTTTPGRYDRQITFDENVYFFTADDDVFHRQSALSPDGHYMAIAQQQGREQPEFTVLLWETEKLNNTHDNPPPEYTFSLDMTDQDLLLAFSPDSSQLAVATTEQTYLLSMPDLALLHSIHTQQEEPPFRLAWSLDSKQFGVIYDRDVMIWDTVEEVSYQKTFDLRYLAIEATATGWYLFTPLEEPPVFNICDTTLTGCDTYEIDGNTAEFLSAHNEIITQRFNNDETTSYIWREVSGEYQSELLPHLDNAQLLSSWNDYLVTSVFNLEMPTQILDSRTGEIINNELPLVRQEVGIYLDEEWLVMEESGCTCLKVYPFEENTPSDVLELEKHPLWETLDPELMNAESYRFQGGGNKILVTYGDFHVLVMVNE